MHNYPITPFSAVYYHVNTAPAECIWYHLRTSFSYETLLLKLD